jgi:hypothetical protein
MTRSIQGSYLWCDCARVVRPTARGPFPQLSVAMATDEVSRNAVWTEHCTREKKALRMNTEFGGVRSKSKSAWPRNFLTQASLPNS